jgi:hypothetical protein
MTPANVMVWAWVMAAASVALLVAVVVLDVAVLRIYAPRSTKVAVAGMWALTFSQSPIWAGWLG